MNQEDYYFVSVGEKSYFYTLNYSYIHINYVKSGIEQRPFPIAERRYTFIRNLSHDFDEAMEKAKAWHKAVKSKNPTLVERTFREHYGECARRTAKYAVML